MVCLSIAQKIVQVRTKLCICIEIPIFQKFYERFRLKKCMNNIRIKIIKSKTKKINVFKTHELNIFYSNYSNCLNIN